MAGGRKKRPKWFEETMQRDKEYRALLEKRKALDEKLEAERTARERDQQ